MLKKLFCKHDKLQLIQEGDWHRWSPTLPNQYKFKGEEQRILTYQCTDCSKQIELLEVAK